MQGGVQSVMLKSGIVVRFEVAIREAMAIGLVLSGLCYLTGGMGGWIVNLLKVLVRGASLVFSILGGVSGWVQVGGGVPPNSSIYSRLQAVNSLFVIRFSFRYV